MKPKCPEITTDIPQITEKLYHIMLYRVHLAWAGFEPINFVVICIDCIGSYKSNYQTITTTTPPSVIGRLLLRYIQHTQAYVTNSVYNNTPSNAIVNAASKAKKIYMCVYCHMSKKSRVGRSGLIFFLSSTKPEIVVPGSGIRFRYLIFENSGKMKNYAVFLPSLLSISTKSYRLNK